MWMKVLELNISCILIHRTFNKMIALSLIHKHIQQCHDVLDQLPWFKSISNTRWVPSPQEMKGRYPVPVCASQRPSHTAPWQKVTSFHISKFLWSITIRILETFLVNGFLPPMKIIKHKTISSDLGEIFSFPLKGFSKCKTANEEFWYLQKAPKS